MTLRKSTARAVPSAAGSRQTARAKAAPRPAKPRPEAYRLVVECRSEREQQALYELLTADGLKVRVLML
jgi:hypothetical protein